MEFSDLVEMFQNVRSDGPGRRSAVPTTPNVKLASPVLPGKPKLSKLQRRIAGMTEDEFAAEVAANPLWLRKGKKKEKEVATWWEKTRQSMLRRHRVASRVKVTQS